MWTTPVDWPLYGNEGSDAGFWVGEFEAGAAPRYRLETYLYGEKYCRIYDLNEVGKAYRSSEEQIRKANPELEELSGKMLLVPRCP